MVGRNEPCPCGSGKKYKKCCESKAALSIEEVKVEELERILQVFYEEYPERRDVGEYLQVANKWKESLQTYLLEEMIEAIAVDEFFFHHRPEIWTGYLEKQRKKALRPSVVNILETWSHPRAFIGEVVAVDEVYLTVKSIFEDETIQLRRESEKPVPVGVHLYCFILPDGTAKENHYLAISSLLFFPTDHQQVFKQFAKQFEVQQNPVSIFLKENGIAFWQLLGEDGYGGGEFTNFEAGVLLEVIDFLEKNERKSEKLVEVLEDYLVEQQPSARKEVAIAAGAIRFGQENGLFEPLPLTIKEIAEWFEVSTSTLNKYYNDLNGYYASKE
ncbi:YecA family protein [Sporosarcina beigongshangi]|uniref:YecA family protein n=1 Tax=Sporosarcina beigongshangi TaxID=2782538 RepID=UPI00193A808B|nr:SEC-C domain-containing protein [Sporosarcina beigongshangi]